LENKKEQSENHSLLKQVALKIHSLKSRRTAPGWRKEFKFEINESDHYALEAGLRLGETRRSGDRLHRPGGALEEDFAGALRRARIARW
jgi:hypothetical protein